MFIGRERELRKLNQMYDSGKLENAIIYGRRRVGKTTLINEFCKDKKTVFFAALENSAALNLTALSGAIVSADHGGAASGLSYQSFADAFARIAEMAGEKRLIFVIDEYPYLAQAYPPISSLLQNFLDHQFKQTRLFLILCGSSMSFMENQVLGYQSPLYGRRTAQFKIQPFDYYETGLWFPNYSPEEKALVYGISGGIPLYLEQFDRRKNIRENLLTAVFDKNALLFEEPSNLLKQELREPASYNAIISAIASGKTKLSEISGTVGMETGLCRKYIENLITLGILKRETPVTDHASRRPLYLLDDLFFRFWYSFVPGNMASILSDRMEQAFPMTVEKYLPDYMGLVFEKICREYLLYYEKALPFDLREVGQWWGTDPKTRKQAQIDIVAASADGKNCIVGSCKFRHDPVSESELKLMRQYAQAMGGFSGYWFYLFSKSGFSAGLTAKRACEDLRLFTITDIYHFADEKKTI